MGTGCQTGEGRCCAAAKEKREAAEAAKRKSAKDKREALERRRRAAERKEAKEALERVRVDREKRQAEQAKRDAEQRERTRRRKEQEQLKAASERERKRVEQERKDAKHERERAEQKQKADERRRKRAEQKREAEERKKAAPQNHKDALEILKEIVDKNNLKKYWSNVAFDEDANRCVALKPSSLRGGYYEKVRFYACNQWQAIMTYSEIKRDGGEIFKTLSKDNGITTRQGHTYGVKPMVPDWKNQKNARKWSRRNDVDRHGNRNKDGHFTKLKREGWIIFELGTGSSRFSIPDKCCW